MAYLKPQSPVKNANGDLIYPITTIDQIMKADGTRLGSGDGGINLTPSELGITPANIGAAASSHTQAGSTITTGGSEGQLCVVNSNGTISPNSRTIASLGTGVTYSLSGTTLYITTL